MRTVHSERFIVPIGGAIALGSHLEALGARILMRDKPMRRAVFKAFDHATGRDSSWVRVRMGDVDPDGMSRCRLTYKIVEDMRDVKVERTIDLSVESYDECVELLSKIGLRPISKQETRRTKYLSPFGDDAMYIVSIDTWPWLEDLRFVNVEPVGGISPDSLEDFLGFLELGEHANYKGGVDAVYRDRLGFLLSKIDDVRFNVPVPEGRSLEDVDDLKGAR